ELRSVLPKSLDYKSPVIVMQSNDGFVNEGVFVAELNSSAQSKLFQVQRWPQASVNLSLAVPPCYDAEDVYSSPGGSKICTYRPRIVPKTRVTPVIEAVQEPE